MHLVSYTVIHDHQPQSPNQPPFMQSHFSPQPNHKTFQRFNSMQHLAGNMVSQGQRKSSGSAKLLLERLSLRWWDPTVNLSHLQSKPPALLSNIDTKISMSLSTILWSVIGESQEYKRKKLEHYGLAVAARKQDGGSNQCISVYTTISSLGNKCSHLKVHRAAYRTCPSLQ